MLTFDFAQGWLDGATPAHVKKVLDDHRDNAAVCHGVLCVWADSHIQEDRSYSGMPIVGAAVDHNAASTIASAFRSLRALIETVGLPGIDVTSWVFLNFRPITSALVARPVPIQKHGVSLAEGFLLFAQAVGDSIEGESIWSTCEWAALTFTQES